MNQNLPKKIIALLILLSLFACNNPQPTNPTITTTKKVTPVLTEIISEPTSETLTVVPAPEQERPANQLQVGYTHIRADGNRFVSGTGHLPNNNYFDIPLPGIPTWIVAIPWEDGSFWAVTLDNANVFGFQINSQGWQHVDISPNQVENGQPPILLMDATNPSLLIAPSTMASLTTHPIPVYDEQISQVFVDIDGNLIALNRNNSEQPPISTNALTDARILKDEKERILIFSDPTSSYGHGVLGDAVEARSITRIDSILSGEISSIITMPNNLVIEGISPIWSDLNGDGIREIIVTVSNAQQGAQILVFDEDGNIIAMGPAIGQGYRWRHQIAVAPLGPNKDLELVDVLTPHIGGVVEFYQWVGDQLIIVAEVPGYTSHIIGSRNLDMAATGDFDGDGSVELLIPNQARSELAAIRRTDTGAEEVWSLPLNSHVTTNLAAITLPDRNIVVGLGLENGILRVWHP